MNRWSIAAFIAGTAIIAACADSGPTAPVMPHANFSPEVIDQLLGVTCPKAFAGKYLKGQSFVIPYSEISSVTDAQNWCASIGVAAEHLAECARRIGLIVGLNPFPDQGNPCIGGNVG